MRLVHAQGVLESDICVVMGIVNRTPDSFYDGGRMSIEASIDHALSLVDQGAAILDIGAVKAGPGVPVTADEERKRLLPLVEGIARRCAVPMSIETARPEIAKAAIETGAAIVNDVSALADDGLAHTCAETGAALVLMHNGGQIRGRPRHPHYPDVVATVTEELLALADRAQGWGVPREALMIDPGLDFGKNTYHSLALMRHLKVLVDTGLPVLVAASRKDIVGETLGQAVEERLEGSLALAALAAHAGAAAVRVHDAAETVAAVAMAEAVAGRLQPRAAVRGLWD